MYSTPTKIKIFMGWIPYFVAAVLILYATTVWSWVGTITAVVIGFFVIVLLTAACLGVQNYLSDNEERNHLAYQIISFLAQRETSEPMLKANLLKAIQAEDVEVHSLSVIWALHKLGLLEIHYLPKSSTSSSLSEMIAISAAGKRIARSDVREFFPSKPRWKSVLYLISSSLFVLGLVILATTSIAADPRISRAIGIGGLIFVAYQILKNGKPNMKYEKEILLFFSDGTPKSLFECWQNLAILQSKRQLGTTVVRRNLGTLLKEGLVSQTDDGSSKPFDTPVVYAYRITRKGHEYLANL
jgi:hypothetical protein